jgi:hypothetical protein
MLKKPTQFDLMLENVSDRNFKTRLNLIDFRCLTR